MAVDAVANTAGFAPEGLKGRQESRFVESLAAEEAAGRLLALKGRTAALIVVGLFLLIFAPFPDVIFYELLLAKHGTYVGPGHWFEVDDRHFRLGFGWPTETELRAGLTALSTAALESEPA